jgi:hypothetical protein
MACAQWWCTSAAVEIARPHPGVPSAWRAAPVGGPVPAFQPGEQLGRLLGRAVQDAVALIHGSSRLWLG